MNPSRAAEADTASEPAWAEDIRRCVMEPVSYRNRQLEVPALLDAVAEHGSSQDAPTYRDLRIFLIRAMQYADDRAALPDPGPERDAWRSAHAHREGARGVLLLPRTLAPDDRSGVPPLEQEALFANLGEGIQYCNAWGAYRWAVALGKTRITTAATLEKRGQQHRRDFAEQLVRDVAAYLAAGSEPDESIADSDLATSPLADGDYADVLHAIQLGRQLIIHTKRRQPRTFEGLGSVLRLFADIQETHEYFLPHIFEPSTVEHIKRNAVNRPGARVGWIKLRRLRTVAEQHRWRAVKIRDPWYRLVDIPRQLEQWDRIAASPEDEISIRIGPSSPEGVSEACAVWERANAILGRLDSEAGRVADGRLGARPLPALFRELEQLQREEGATRSADSQGQSAAP